MMGLSGAVLVGFGINERLGLLLLGLFWFQVCLVLSIVPHELGHALVARWLGFKVQSIVVGFGRPILRGRFIGFDWIVRYIPYGGATVVQQFADRRLRFRQCLYILAGPAANFLLASIAWVLVTYSAFNRMEGSLVTNGWWIFISANLLVVVVNLYPSPVDTPLGVIPSDGLTLLLLFNIRSEEEVSALLRKSGDSMQTQTARLKYIAWGVITTIIGGGSLILAFLVGYLSVKDPALKSVTLVLVVLVGMGLVLLWFAVRCWKLVVEGGGVKPSGNGPRRSSPYAQVIEAYGRELSSHTHWPTGFSPGVFMMEVSRLDAAKDWAGKERLIADTIRNQPDNLMLKVMFAEVMENQGRLTESVETYASITALHNIPVLMRFVVQMNRCLLLGRLGLVEEVRAMVPRQLNETVPVAGKALFLDSLACLPMTHGVRTIVPYALEWIKQAQELDPGSITLRGTLGMLQFESGQLAEAETTLREVLDKSEEDNDIGIASLYLALCAKHKGKLAEANKLGRRARRTYPESWLLKRLSDELPGL